MEVLVNKQFKNYGYLSRYTPFPIFYHTIDKKYVQGTTAYLANNTQYTVHVVEKGDTFDSLALHYYNNPTLYWIICSYNHIQDPFTQLPVGSEIKIPSMSNIEFNIE